MLTGKYRPGADPPPSSRAASARMGRQIQRRLDDVVLRAVDRLRPVAETAGLSLPHLALAWVPRRADVSSAVVGASRPEQVRHNAAASGVALSADVLAAVDAALAEVAVTEPVLADGAEPGVLRGTGRV